MYMLRCGDGSLYTGIAKDLAARLRQHEAGRASRYTSAHMPVTLAWSRRLATWSAALREEHRIKQLCRRDKEALVRKRIGVHPSRRRRAGPGEPPSVPGSGRD